MENLLIVEDSEQNISDAISQLGNIRIARTLNEFDKEFSKDKPTAVLSDLYFPTGYGEKENELVRKELTEILSNYITEHRKQDCLGKVLDLVFDQYGLKTLDEFFEHPTFKNDSVVAMPRINEMVKESYRKNEENRKYNRLLDRMQIGLCQLPSGVFVYKKCKGDDVPCVIVTSAYHHGIEFQPFVYHVGKYFDKLVDGKKPWKEAFDSLIGRN